MPEITPVHDWSEAFSICRERNKPQRVRDGDVVTLIFPSGCERPAHGQRADLAIDPAAK